MRQNEQPIDAREELRRHAVHLNALAAGDARARTFYDAPPSSGRHQAGDVRDCVPFIDGGVVYIGWVCIETGEPGTWHPRRA